MPHIDFVYSIAGFGVGILVGLTGVGGGSLMTPILVLLFGVHPATAVGTDLLYAASTKSVGTAVHSAHGTVDWAVVRRLATGSVPASAVTLAALAWVGPRIADVERVLTLVLGAVLIATAIAILFRSRILHRFVPVIERQGARRIAWLTVALGVVLGVLVSLTSVGAGAIGVTALLTLYPHLPMSRLVGSDIAHAVPLTLAAGAGHWAMGSVDVALLLSLLVGSVPGIVLGSLVSTRVADRALQPVMAVVLVLVGGKLIF